MRAQKWHQECLSRDGYVSHKIKTGIEVNQSQFNSIIASSGTSFDFFERHLGSNDTLLERWHSYTEHIEKFVRVQSKT